MHTNENVRQTPVENTSRSGWNQSQGRPSPKSVSHGGRGRGVASSRTSTFPEHPRQAWTSHQRRPFNPTYPPPLQASSHQDASEVDSRKDYLPQRGGYGGYRGGRPNRHWEERQPYQQIASDGHPGARTQRFQGTQGRYTLVENLTIDPVDFSRQQLVEKCIEYYEHPDVASRTREDELGYLSSIAVSVEGNSVPKVIRHFHEAPFPQWIQDAFVRANFAAPQPIQQTAWPVALSGRDVIGIAKTGCGKTLAFLLPGIVHLLKQPPVQPNDGPIVLVLAPTRELAMQIHQEAQRFSPRASTGVRSVCVYGGAKRHVQVSQLHQGVEVLIATPGRLLDLLKAGETKLTRVTYAVLDEADRMLDMGFEPQIRSVMDQVRPDRQTLMFSATWPKEVQDLAKRFMRLDPVKIIVGRTELHANEDIQQKVLLCEPLERFDIIAGWLNSNWHLFDPRRGGRCKVLIFVGMKRTCEELLAILRQKTEIAMMTIHGDKAQPERDRALTAFKSGSCNVLIGTDVASRGLDIKHVDFVVNFDVPKSVEDYIHRIGRTGRAGATGMAITLFPRFGLPPEQKRVAAEINKLIVSVGQEPSSELAAICNLSPPTKHGHRPPQAGSGPRWKTGRNNDEGRHYGYRAAAQQFKHGDGAVGSTVSMGQVPSPGHVIGDGRFHQQTPSTVSTGGQSFAVTPKSPGDEPKRVQQGMQRLGQRTVASRAAPVWQDRRHPNQQAVLSSVQPFYPGIYNSDRGVPLPMEFSHVPVDVPIQHWDPQPRPAVPAYIPHPTPIGHHLPRPDDTSNNSKNVFVTCQTQS